MTRNVLLTSFFALALHAQMITNGTVDQPARFNGLTYLTTVDGQSCIGSGRVESLFTRGYISRYHYIFQSPGCRVYSLTETQHVNITTLPDGQSLTVAGWGIIRIIPLDPEVRAWHNAQSKLPNSNPNGLMVTVTVKPIDADTWEVLLEQPE
jgi:hypothetical protein